MEDLLDIDLKELEVLDKFKIKKEIFKKRGKRIRKFQRKLKEREKDTRYEY